MQLLVSTLSCFPEITNIWEVHLRQCYDSLAAGFLTLYLDQVTEFSVM